MALLCTNHDSRAINQDVDHGGKSSSKLDCRSRTNRSMKVSNIKKYVGVRQRPSGRWVAEIKNTSQRLRLWLGTFDRPEDAAMAYDNAARILRGRNAKTNFTHHDQIMKSSTLEGNHGAEVGKIIPRFYQLHRHAITKNHAQESSLQTPNHKAASKDQRRLIEFSSLVEETIVCPPSSNCNNYVFRSYDCYRVQEGDGKDIDNGFTYGGSKVYSSVVVAPSFSACTQLGQEKEFWRTK